jgi:hypothetical protein
MKFILCFLITISTAYAANPHPSTPAEMVTAFLGYLGSADGDAALKLWDNASTTDKVKARIGMMAQKVRTLGGIKKVDVQSCEPRRMKSFENKTGEKIDVVPVEVICGNESLILAVFSIRRTGDGYRIFQLESLKEWGGTTSLDDDLQYSH